MMTVWGGERFFLFFPSANMYGCECGRKAKKGSCSDKRCIFPEICPDLNVNHARQTSLLKKLRQIKGVKKAVVASGVRFDMIMADKKSGKNYMRELVHHHVSGQMKVAPEHSESVVLELMGKSGVKALLEFRSQFLKETAQADNPKQFLTYYLIAAHPGCTIQDMRKLAEFTSKKLRLRPEQVQVFTPTPSTYSTLMYYTSRNPFTGQSIFVEKKVRRREEQKKTLTSPYRHHP